MQLSWKDFVSWCSCTKWEFRSSMEMVFFCHKKIYSSSLNSSSCTNYIVDLEQITDNCFEQGYKLIHSPWGKYTANTSGYTVFCGIGHWLIEENQWHFLWALLSWKSHKKESLVVPLFSPPRPNFKLLFIWVGSFSALKGKVYFSSKQFESWSTCIECKTSTFHRQWKHFSGSNRCFHANFSSTLG